MNQPQMKITPAFHIRKDIESDIPAIAELMSNENIFPLLGAPPFLTATQLTPVLAGRAREDLGLCCYVGNTLAGFAQITRAHPAIRRSHAFSMMVAVHPDFQGQGIAQALIQELIDYADQWTPCKRIEIVVEQTNETAIAIYKKFGFEQEGIHKGYVLSHGKFQDVIAMARLKI